MNKEPKTKAQFILEFTEALKGELLTHLDYQNDQVEDIVSAVRITKHMGYSMCGVLTKEVLK